MSSIIRATTTSGLQIAPDNSGSLQLQTNGTTTAVTIDTSQNVGIGTTSPATKLESKGSAEVLRLTTTGDVSSSGTVYQRFNDVNGNAAFVGFGGGAASGFEINNLKSGPMLFTNAGAERMRIDSSGNVFIAKTSDTDAAQGISFYPSGNASFNDNNSGTRTVIGFRRSGTSVGTISTTASSTAYNTSSDYRLKENIVPMTGALDTVSALKPVTYTWKIDNSAGQGFIAHELAEIVPEAVTGKKDAVNEDGTIKPQGIDTSFLVATLTAAIQEMKAIIDEQSATINDLKARIETLEAK